MDLENRLREEMERLGLDSKRSMMVASRLAPILSGAIEKHSLEGSMSRRMHGDYGTAEAELMGADFATVFSSLNAWRAKNNLPSVNSQAAQGLFDRYVAQNPTWTDQQVLNAMSLDYTPKTQGGNIISVDEIAKNMATKKAGSLVVPVIAIGLLVVLAIFGSKKQN